MSDLPQRPAEITPSGEVDPLKAKHSKLLKERARRHAAETERDQFRTDLDLANQRADMLQAALDATRENAETELDKAAKHIAKDRADHASALIAAREDGYQLGRVAERAEVKPSVSAADLDKMAEPDRKRLIDIAAAAAARKAAARMAPTPSTTPLLDGLAGLASSMPTDFAPLSQLGMGMGKRTGH